MKLHAHNLGWTTRGKTIVDDVTLDILPGETFGLVGPNGSGKSTLLRLLTGLLPRPAGRVHLEGVPLESMSRRDIAQRIAFVEQMADTSEALRVRDAVELGRTPWLSALTPLGPEDRRIVTEALEATGLAHMAGHSWSTLSGGERQRVHIARALAQRPRLLVLDEPTNHLDIHHQLSLLRLVSMLSVTVVMALHDLNQAMGCDRVGVMENGRLIACGPPAEVLTPARIAAIFRVHVTPLRDPDDNATLFRFHCLEDHS
ncbi:ABC transporter ATP-binding protein [Celeribacter persicus]|uniref:Iron complex transport system ATP-binding protein n=1 Tax=Celeribacter persicus TaxID=1651082 RepID=A0A2T5HWR7_9RHOB|nr:ABC transporter ATP-binding protein [Celeribacter persicus]PTQ75995.1 iron complex transport system ATP-binding protein [Celeribacter persicus]